MERKIKPLIREEKPSKGAFSKIFSKKKKEITHGDVEEESVLEDLTGASEEFLDEEGLWNLGDIKEDLVALEVKDESVEDEYILDLTSEDMVKTGEPQVEEKPLEGFGEEFELEDLIKEPGLEEVKEPPETEIKEELLETLSQKELQDILKEVEETEKEGLEIDLEGMEKEFFPSEVTPEIEELEEISGFEEVEKDEIPGEISFGFEKSPEIAKVQEEEFKVEGFEEIPLEYEEAVSPEIEVSPGIEIGAELEIAQVEEEPEKIMPQLAFELEETKKASTIKRNEVIFSKATQDALEKTVRQAVEDITAFVRDTLRDTIEKVSSETIPKVLEKYLRK